MTDDMFWEAVRDAYNQAVPTGQRVTTELLGRRVDVEPSKGIVIIAITEYNYDMSNKLVIPPGSTIED